MSDSGIQGAFAANLDGAAAVGSLHSTMAQASAARPRPRGLGVWVRALRVHQYAKNTLIFLPMIAGHVLDWGAFNAACLAFISFSAAASAIYLVNDCVDREDDRLHPTKKFRPLAAGQISVFEAALICAGLLVVSGAVALLLPVRFALTLAGYLALTTVYSFWLKRKLVVDVVLLSVLYEIRVVAGAYAAGVELSNWLLCFCLLVFASLALTKRYSELLLRLDADLPESRSRGYRKEDVPVIVALAAATGVNAVTVLGLYIDSHNVALLYHHRQWLWALCPLMLLLVSRALLAAHRREMHDDPIVWALRDRTSRVGGVLFIAIMSAAAFL